MTTTSEDIRQALASGRERLLAAIAGVSEEQFKRRPSIEGQERPWSIAEVLAHLLQQERLRGERLARALTDDGATIEPSAPEEHEKGALVGRMSPVPQLIHGLLASRREIERLLDEAAALPDGLERAIVHPREGRQTVEWLLREKVIAHEAEHVAQVLALRAEIGAAALPGARA